VLAVATVGSAGFVTLAAGPAVAATTGTITGKVTAAAGGAGLSGICVGAYAHGVDPQQLLVDTATVANGNYTLANVPTGSVDVRFSASGLCPGGTAANLVTQWFNNQRTQLTATTVVVSSGATTANINAAMAAGGSISGHVTKSAGGADLAGVCVGALVPGVDEELVASTSTIANGTYSLSGVPAGDVHVEFFSSGFCPGGAAANYVTQWYNGKLTADNADLVHITVGGTTTGIDAALSAAGSVSGVVTAASGGAPLSGICVAVYVPYQLGVAPELITSNATAADGTYTVDGAPAGSVDIKFFATGFCPGGVSSNYTQQWYQNQPLQASADPVTVVAGATVPNINAALVAGGSIAGTVKAKTGGAGLFGICVAAFSTGANPVLVASTGTSAGGVYHLDGITPGTVRVRFNSAGFCPGGVVGNYIEQWWNNKASYPLANNVSVALGATTSNIDAAMVGVSAFSITVNGAASSTVGYGGAVTLAESGLPGAATGKVVFNSPGHPNLCTITLPATSCVVPAALAVGSYTPITAAFTDTDGGLTNSTSTNSVSLTVAAAKPAAPLGPHATVGSDKVVTVTWTAPANDGGSPITGYAVSVSPGGAKISVPAAATHATVSGLLPGTYSFEVSATSIAGPGAWSPASNSVSIAKPRSGYWMLGALGRAYAFGDAAHLGDASGPVVAMATRRDGLGYWIVDARGTVRHFGAAADHGGKPALRFGEAVSTISATPSGNGYWLFTNRGRAFAFGDAHFYGDMSKVRLNGPVIASSATPTGHGYYMVGSDGGVFTFGDAKFHGSTGGMHLNRPIVGISPTPDNKGYWLVASDGGVFAFNAPFRGSMGHKKLNQPVNGLVSFGNGYLMVASDGGVFNFSDKPFSGSFGSHPPTAPIIGITAFTTN
jgi:hypothetical protein